MTPSSAVGTGSANTRRTYGAAGWLALAASPVFAVMAWIAAKDASGMALCSPASSTLPIDGMSAMYLLMSLFHLPPWLKLVSGRLGAGT